MFRVSRISPIFARVLPWRRFGPLSAQARPSLISEAILLPFTVPRLAAVQACVASIQEREQRVGLPLRADPALAARCPDRLHLQGSVVWLREPVWLCCEFAGWGFGVARRGRASEGQPTAS